MQKPHEFQTLNHTQIQYQSAYDLQCKNTIKSYGKSEKGNWKMITTGYTDSLQKNNIEKQTTTVLHKC